MRPTDKKELFNLHHSSLRNVIERAFALLKSGFKILKNQAEYHFKTQAMIVVACVLLHNHILVQNTLEEEDEFLKNESSDDESSSSSDETDEEEDDKDDIVPIDDEGVVVGNDHWDEYREELVDNMWAGWNVGDDDDDYMTDVDD
ncbi:uncharacterized protein LOC122639068 [Telopea speciosissima]|uniref:uncharacterized protein LOC122639068 n=1 Tax=Telopea speciosissima TaxID=54955 RepID=UPI001CC78273|nr:uncharacterized protein LOC122639068 [Telopea speciosissima]